jgi:hypothetical protein
MSFEPAIIRLDPVMNQRYVTMMGVALNQPTSGTLIYTKGTILGEFSASASAGTYAGYSSSATNGLQIPKGILQYTSTVDSSGNITIFGEFSQTQRGTPMYMPGMAIWKVTDLIGLDANAVTVMGASYVEGSSAGGLIQI